MAFIISFPLAGAYLSWGRHSAVRRRGRECVSLTSSEGGLTRGALSESGGDDVSENDLVDVFRVQLDGVEGSADRDRAELRSLDLRDLAEEGADGRSLSGDNVDRARREESLAVLVKHLFFCALCVCVLVCEEKKNKIILFNLSLPRGLFEGEGAVYNALSAQTFAVL